MRKLLIVTSILEMFVGLALIFFPHIILNLLFGINSDNELNMVSRLTGLVYAVFAISCFPSKDVVMYSARTPAVRAMFLYNFLAAAYFFYLKTATPYDGTLLLPAIILHSLITLYFVFVIWKKQN